ncbi:hypothetical protein V2I01_26005 [Micromonospora sp. BRA006-A]|nr:hypothetical protein [Micromonospora sp. BRA006-A]
MAYLAGLVVLAFVHPFLPAWRWTAIHLLLLGAVSNAVVVWSAHFAAAVLRAPAPDRRRAEAARLAALNVGVLAVLTGGTADRPWLGVAGATLVFVAVTAHLVALTRRLRRALPARFSVTVRYYLAATVALLAGVPVGAGMLVIDDPLRPRLLLFHAHVNLLGWVTLTVLGTLLTLWPTVLRTRMADGAVRAATVALPVATTGLVLLGVGLLAWWRLVAAAGLSLFALGALIARAPRWPSRAPAPVRVRVLVARRGRRLADGRSPWTPRRCCPLRTRPARPTASVRCCSRCWSASSPRSSSEP